MNLNIILKTGNLTCKEVLSHVCENIGEPDDSPLCLAIQDHLENCKGCKDFKDSLQKTIELYKNYNVEFPESAHKKLLECLNLKEE